MVYLDLSHQSREFLEDKLGGIMEIYRKFAGDDPCETPMKIFPGVHYSMGGLWATYTPGDDYEKARDGSLSITETKRWDPQKCPDVGMKLGAPDSMMTNITGLYAFGEVNYQYHGGTRLGANALLSCIFDGLFCGPGVVNYVNNEVKTPAESLDEGIFDSVVAQEEMKAQALIDAQGDENPYELGIELGEEMTAAATVVKTEQRMLKAMETLRQLQDRYTRLRLSDTGLWTNQNLSYSRALGDMLKLAEVILQGSILRKESRGAHYRTDYPQRDDENFLKTTIAEYDPQSGRPKFRYEEVEAALVAPRARTYA